MVLTRPGNAPYDSGLALDGSGHAGPFPTEAEARKWAEAHDPEESDWRKPRGQPQRSQVITPVVPVQEVLTVGGKLVWRICAGVHCVEAHSGADAWHKLRHLCREHGITLATTGVTEPTVGPPPLPDPGV
jgi:hypothetical protein